jgi:chromosome partitioning protein
MAREALIVATGSNKGGTAKTTSVLHLGAALAYRGAKVLLLDADPQATLSETLLPLTSEAMASDPDSGLAGFITGARSPRQVIARYPELPELQDYALPLDVLPTHAAVVAAMERGPESERNALLANRLGDLVHLYDFIVIDVGPNFTRLQIAALAAGDLVLSPLKCDDAALRAHRHFVERIEAARQVSPHVRLWGVLPTFYDRRHGNDRDALAQIQARHSHDGVTVFPPVVESTEFEKVITGGLPLITQAGVDEKGRAQPYLDIADALLSTAARREVA